MSDPHRERLEHAVKWMDIREIRVVRSGPDGGDVVVVFGPGLWASLKVSELREILQARL